MMPSDRPSRLPSNGPTATRSVTDFKGLKGAIDTNDGDIELGPGTIVFTEQIRLIGKQLTFTCPDSDCVLDAESNSRFFYIEGGTSNISFDGITFKNGKANVSSQ
jgi:hypothetical protein